jgi:hypothetical protein
MSRVAAVVTMTALSTGTLASAASAASVKVNVPSNVKKGSTYTIQVTGSYKPSELKGRAYLIALIQFNARPCQATAQAENRWVIRNHQTAQYYFAPTAHPQRVGIFVPKSFTEVDHFTGGDVTTRHVCAYLYPKFIHAGDTTGPIGQADKRYAVTRR